MTYCLLFIILKVTGCGASTTSLWGLFLITLEVLLVLPPLSPPSFMRALFFITYRKKCYGVERNKHGTGRPQKIALFSFACWCFQVSFNYFLRSCGFYFNCRKTDGFYWQLVPQEAEAIYLSYFLES